MNVYTSFACVIVVIVEIASLAAAWYFTKRAVEGWEDEEGFHRGKQNES